MYTIVHSTTYRSFMCIKSLDSISGQFYLNPLIAGPFWPALWHRVDCYFLLNF